MDRIFKLAALFARTSTHEKHKHASVLIKGNEIIWAAVNDSIGGLHSEENLVNQVADLGVLSKATAIVNVRINTKTPHILRMSKPCLPCQIQLMATGVPELFYSTNEGFMQVKLSALDPHAHKVHSQSRLARAISSTAANKSVLEALRGGIFGDTGCLLNN
jgi:deoxycytidylate deaminase